MLFTTLSPITPPCLPPLPPQLSFSPLSPSTPYLPPHLPSGQTVDSAGTVAHILGTPGLSAVLHAGEKEK